MAEDFRQLFDAFASRVCAFFRHQGFPAHEAEELTQDTLLRVYVEMGSLHSADPTAWIFTIARNIGRNEVRRQTTKKRQSPPVEELRMNAASHPRPDQRLLQKELERRVQRAIDELPPQRRRCLRLRAQGRSIEEIGTILRLNPNTVKPHLAQAREQLREALAATAEAAAPEARGGER